MLTKNLDFYMLLKEIYISQRFLLKSTFAGVSYSHLIFITYTQISRKYFAEVVCTFMEEIQNIDQLCTFRSHASTYLVI